MLTLDFERKRRSRYGGALKTRMIAATEDKWKAAEAPFSHRSEGLLQRDPKTIMAAGHIWLQLLCALIALHTARSIRCWECNSHYDRNCADPFQNETFALTDCDQRDLEHMLNQKATVCRKIVQKVRDDYRFVRGCGWLSSEKEGVDCFKRAGTFNVLIQYCSCEHDGCNSSPRTRLLSAASALLVIVAIFI